MSRSFHNRSPSRCSQIVCGDWVGFDRPAASPKAKMICESFPDALAYPDIHTNLLFARELNELFFSESYLY